MVATENSAADENWAGSPETEAKPAVYLDGLEKLDTLAIRKIIAHELPNRNESFPESQTSKAKIPIELYSLFITPTAISVYPSEKLSQGMLINEGKENQRDALLEALHHQGSFDPGSREAYSKKHPEAVKPDSEDFRDVMLLIAQCLKKIKETSGFTFRELVAYLQKLNRILAEAESRVGGFKELSAELKRGNRAFLSSEMKTIQITDYQGNTY